MPRSARVRPFYIFIGALPRYRTPVTALRRLPPRIETTSPPYKEACSHNSGFPAGSGSDDSTSTGPYNIGPYRVATRTQLPKPCKWLCQAHYDFESGKLNDSKSQQHEEHLLTNPAETAGRPCGAGQGVLR